jgi:hypothetical protein
LGYLNQDGILKTGNLQRTSASITLTPRLLDDHLKIDLNLKGLSVIPGMQMRALSAQRSGLTQLSRYLTEAKIRWIL